MILALFYFSYGFLQYYTMQFKPQQLIGCPDCATSRNLNGGNLTVDAHLGMLFVYL